MRSSGVFLSRASYPATAWSILPRLLTNDRTAPRVRDRSAAWGLLAITNSAARCMGSTSGNSRYGTSRARWASSRSASVLASLADASRGPRAAASLPLLTNVTPVLYASKKVAYFRGWAAAGAGARAAKHKTAKAGRAMSSTPTGEEPGGKSG